MSWKVFFESYTGKILKLLRNYNDVVSHSTDSSPYTSSYKQRYFLVGLIIHYSAYIRNSSAAWHYGLVYCMSATWVFIFQRIQGCKDVFRTLYGFVAQDGVHNLTGCTLLRESFPYGHPALGVFASDPEADAHSLISNCEKRLQCIREVSCLAMLDHYF